VLVVEGLLWRANPGLAGPQARALQPRPADVAADEPAAAEEKPAEPVPAEPAQEPPPPPGVQDEPEPDPEPEPEPEPQRVRVLQPVPDLEPEPDSAPQTEPPTVPPPAATTDAESNVVPIGIGDEPRRWNLWDLERLTRERSGRDAARDEERSFLLMYMREFAGPDGLLPADFDRLVRDSFGELVGAG
jgi:outer membrane biosynthesis protein TonB